MLFYNSELYYQINNRIALYSDIINIENKAIKTFSINGTIGANPSSSIESTFLTNISAYTYMILFVTVDFNYSLQYKISFDTIVTSSQGYDLSKSINILSHNHLALNFQHRDSPYEILATSTSLYYYAHNSSDSQYNSVNYTIGGFYVA